MSSRFARVAIAGFVVPCLLLPLAGTCAADEFPPIAPELIAAWEQAGARAGWLCLNPVGSLSFNADRKAAEKITARLDQAMGFTRAIPAFQFHAWKAGELTKLSAPGTPFGLCLKRIPTEAELAAIAEMKQLVVLELSCPIENRVAINPLGREQLKTVARAANLQVLSLERSFDFSLLTRICG